MYLVTLVTGGANADMTYVFASYMIRCIKLGGGSENLSPHLYRRMGKPIEKNLSVQKIFYNVEKNPMKNLGDLLKY